MKILLLAAWAVAYWVGLAIALLIGRRQGRRAALDEFAKIVERPEWHGGAD